MNNVKKFLIPIFVFAALGLCGFLAMQSWQSKAEAAPPDIALVAHKAIYDFKLKALQSGAQLSSIDGELYFEQDNLCDAWTTDHRFSATYYYPEQRGVKNTSHFIAWEAKDGSAFQFNSERNEGNSPPEQLRGYIEKKTEETKGPNDRAVYIRPANLTYDLKPGYFLPSAHTREIIRRAKRGDTFFNAIVFDGTDADGPVEINTFIGKAATQAEIDASKKALNNQKSADLLSLPAWHVHMTAFLESDKETMTPLYVMDYIQHDNGVISDAIIDYGEFKVEQILTSIEALPAHTCVKTDG